MVVAHLQHVPVVSVVPALVTVTPAAYAEAVIEEALTEGMPARSGKTTRRQTG